MTLITSISCRRIKIYKYEWTSTSEMRRITEHRAPIRRIVFCYVIGFIE